MKHSIHCAGYRGRNNEFSEVACDCKRKTGPKLGTGGKRNKLRICLTADVEAFLERNGDTIGTAVETSVRKSAAFKRWLTQGQ